MTTVGSDDDGTATVGRTGAATTGSGAARTASFFCCRGIMLL